MKRLATVLASLALALAIVAPASADSRCNGRPGIQFWEHTSKGGASIQWCWPAIGTGGIFISNMGSYSNNLNFGATWNDRASSYETFNFTGHSLRLYADASYSSASVGGRVVDQSGNGYVSNMGNLWSSALSNGFNDLVTSFKTTK